MSLNPPSLTHRPIKLYRLIHLSPTLRHSWRVILLSFSVCVALSLLSGCDGMNGCEGGGATFPPKDKIQSAVQVRVTETGFETISDVVTPIIKDALPPELNSCLPGDSGQASFIEWRYCNMETCANGETGCNISIGVGEVNLSAIEPSSVRASVTLDELSLRFDVGADPIVDCDIAIDGPGVPVNLDLILSTPEPERNLGIVVSDASYELSELTIRLEGNDGFLSPLCEVLDGAFNLPFIREIVLDLMEGVVDGVLIVALQGAINSFICQPCEGEEDPICTTQGGSCILGSCIREDLTCVARPLGLEGESDIGELLSSVTPNLSAPLGYFLNPGSYAEVEEDGLSLGVIAGTNATLNRCVPPATPPMIAEPPRATVLRSNVAPDGQEYDLGLGLSQTFLDQALWSVYTSGATCLSITTATAAQLNSSTLQILLPNLNKLTRGQAPVALTLSPQTPPIALIGENRLGPPNDRGERELEDPLLTIDWPDLWIDFHVFMDDRWTRIFSLKSRVVLPLGVTFDPEGGLIPLLGDLNAALTEIEVANDEILLDDTSRIETLLPTLTGPLIGAALSSLSEPIALPDILGFRLAPREGSVRGIREGDEDFIAIFADLALAPVEQMEGMGAEEMMGIEEMNGGMGSNGMKSLELPEKSSLSQTVRAAHERLELELEGDVSAETAQSPVQIKLNPLETRAQVSSVFAPPSSHWIHAPHDHTLRPSVTLSMNALSLDPHLNLNEAEFSWQVDSQGWHPFTSAKTLTIHDPAFMLPGDHLIEVRARERGDIFSLDPTPVSLSVRLYDPPNVDELSDATPRGIIGRADPALASSEGDPSGCACSHSHSSQARRAHTLGWAIALLLFILARPRRWTTARDHHNEADQKALSRESSRGIIRTLWLILLMVSFGVSLGGCDDETRPRKDPNAQGECKLDECGANQICVEGACATVTCLEDERLCDQLDCGEAGAECNADGVCQCQDTPICPDGCGESEYCCYMSNTCEAPPAPCAQLAESLNCPEGFEPGVTTRGEINAELCQIEGEVCDCVESTPLEVSSIGRFSDLAYDRGRQVAWVSAYVDEYGDLAVGRVAEEGEITWYWVDGVPSDAPVVAAPSGPRGGVEEAGEDVGRYTSLAIDGMGHLHIAYFNVSQQSLKYAHGTVEEAEVRWNVMTLDDGRPLGADERPMGAGAGWWTDIELDSLGRPSIIYRALSAPTAEEEVTSEVRFISAGEATPISRDAWGAPQSLHEVTPPAELMSLGYPEGTGLFNNLVMTSSGMSAAWYNRSGGDLMRTASTGAGWEPSAVIAGWSHETRRGDLGANVHFAVDAEDASHFCYQDGATDSLRYLSPELELDEWVDDGVRLAVDGREYSLHVVGDDCRVSFDERGRVMITYQDATSHELLVARRDAAGGWLRITVRGPNLGESQASSGFYARGVSLGEELLLSHYIYDHQAEPPRQRLEVIRVPSP